MDNITAGLQSINCSLQAFNEIAQKMLDTMQKPENKFIKILPIIGLGAGALAIFNIMENIIKWVIRGG